MKASSGTVLIVEDESIMVMLLERRLKAAGFSVCDSVATKDEAVESAVRNKPGYVIMDIRLGDDSDGIEAAQEILQKISTKVIFTTGYSSEQVMQRAEALKPAAYLVKPFNISELISIMTAQKN